MTQTLKIEKTWDEVKALITEVEPGLAGVDLSYDGKDATPLLERLAAKMGRDKAHVKDWIESVSANKGKAY